MMYQRSIAGVHAKVQGITRVTCSRSKASNDVDKIKRENYTKEKLDYQKCLLMSHS